MSDPFKKVRPGDELHLSAASYNAIVDVAKAEAESRFDRETGIPETRRDGAIVRVKNETGADLPRYAVVGLDAPIFTPSDSEDAFLREVTFRGVVPTAGHATRFAIVLEPAPPDRVVRAFVAGTCPVMVDVEDSEHRCAAAEPGETGFLVSGASGPAQILWRAGGTGPQWTIVLFGTACSGMAPEPDPDP